MRMYLGEVYDIHPHHDRAWTVNAGCAEADPTLFFPNPGANITAALAICHTCPVRDECLEYALTHRERHGIWGGASERERRRIARDRRRA